MVWFRPHALRTQDNEALRGALGKPTDDEKLRFVFLWDPPPMKGGTASDVFLVQALASLNETLQGRLEVFELEACEQDVEVFNGECWRMVTALRKCTQELFPEEDDSNTELFYLETYDHELEDKLFQQLEKCRLVARPTRGSHTLLDYHGSQDPKTNRNPDLDPARLVRQAIEKHPFASPLIPFVDHVVDHLEKNPPSNIQPLDLELLSHNLHILPPKKPFLSIQDLMKQVGTTRRTDWGTRIAERWPAKEEAAADALEQFVKAQYPSLVGAQEKQQKQTHLASHLSPYLARGLLSPQQVYQALGSSNQDPQNSFLRRMAWRDYAYAVSAVFPEQPIRQGYYEAPPTGNNNPKALGKWKQGQTGFPLVDAGMRQLLLEGFMPQQVRLAVSACLVEGLNVDWKDGMQHFAEFLVDYDEVINGHMWMNAASVGLDPYYIGLDYKKRPYWDADGSYVRKWCPELQQLPDRVEVAPSGAGGTNTVDALYTPWKAPSNVLEEAGVVLGDTYPQRICDEREGRKSFLQRLRHCRSSWPASKIDHSGNDVIEIGGEMVGAFTPRCLKV